MAFRRQCMSNVRIEAVVGEGIEGGQRDETGCIGSSKETERIERAG